MTQPRQYDVAKHEALKNYTVKTYGFYVTNATRKIIPQNSLLCIKILLGTGKKDFLIKNLYLMAIGEISENPSDNAVTRPTVPEARDEDIERKLRLYGMFYAFRYGKLPSNRQINVALTSAVESNMLTNPSEQLSSEGRTLVKELRDVIDSAKYLWLKKNYNEEFQNFLYHTIQASTTPNVDAPLNKDQVKEHSDQALQGLRTLGRLLVTNGQFRKLLDDATLLARDMIADSASKATQKIRPEQGRLAKIDEPAEDHTWHEAPPSIGGMKSIVQSKINIARGAPQGVQNQVQQEAQGAVQDASRGSRGQFDPQEVARRAAGENDNQISRSDIGGQTAVSGRDVGSSTKAQVQEYLKERFPKERRDQTIYRLKKMIAEIQQHEDYLEAIDTLISLVEEYAGHAKSVGKDTNREVQHSADDPNVQSSYYELKTLLENFADWTSMDDMFDGADDLIADANNDPEFKRWAKNLDHFIRKCLRENGYILKDESTDEWNKLSEQGRYFLNDRYKEHSERLTDEINKWFEYMANDPDSVAFGKKVQKLFLALGQDNNGAIDVKRHLLKDVTDVIIPGFLENLKYVPIPRIEVSDPMIDAVVENLVIESENLMPNILEIHADSFFRFGRKKIHNRKFYRFSVHVSQIQCDLKDIAYYIRKKQGFPRITDTGVMDLFLGGQGLSFDMKLASADQGERNRIFKVESVKAKVKNLNIILKKSNHKTLFNFFKPLLMSVVKPAISKAAEVQIRRSFDQLDEQMWLVQKEYNKTKEAAKEQPPEETRSAFNMYIQAIEKRIIQLNEDAKSSNEKINVALTKETSPFPNIHLPGGISTKAAKYREIAREGDEWRSPIFDLGTTKPRPIPEPKKITRKSHYQHSGYSINGRANTATSSSTGEPQTSSRGFSDSSRVPQDAGLGSAVGATSAAAAYTSLSSDGYESTSRSTGNSTSNIPEDGLNAPGSKGYQPNMTTAVDSTRTAAEQKEFDGPHVGNYNVTGSQLHQDPISKPYSGAEDTDIASQDHSRQVC